MASKASGKENRACGHAGSGASTSATTSTSRTSASSSGSVRAKDNNNISYLLNRRFPPGDEPIVNLAIPKRVQRLLMNQQQFQSGFWMSTNLLRHYNKLTVFEDLRELLFPPQLRYDLEDRVYFLYLFLRPEPQTIASIINPDIVLTHECKQYKIEQALEDHIPDAFCNFCGHYHYLQGKLATRECRNNFCNGCIHSFPSQLEHMCLLPRGCFQYSCRYCESRYGSLYT